MSDRKEAMSRQQREVRRCYIEMALVAAAALAIAIVAYITTLVNP